MGKTINKPNLYLAMLEIRVFAEIGAGILLKPLLERSPKGDGHPVIIIPGFGTGDFATLLMRRFLKKQGYAVHGWGQGINLGSKPEVRSNLFKLIKNLHETHSKKVSLIGWSLGGVFARELARKNPDFIRTVITLGCPFSGDMMANNMIGLSNLISGKKVTARDLESFEQRKKSPPVPVTAIHSRTDGVVAWECSLEKESEMAENISVFSSHFGLTHNPMVLGIISNRLSQLEGKWTPFKK